MSFPSVQQAPVYTPAASSMPQQTAYIQQGRCGNCGVTLNPYPQTQLNQGASDQYQASAQEGVQSSGGTLQDSYQFSQASGQSYVGGKGGQQQAEATPEDLQSQYGSESGEPEAGKPAAETSTAKAGFDFAAFLSPLNPEERAEAARAAAARESASLPEDQEEQGQIEQAQSDESSFEHIQSGYGQSQKSEQIQGGGGYSQGATVQSGQSGRVQTGSHGQGEQVQSPHTQAGSVAPGQTGQISSLSGGQYGQSQMTGQMQGSGGYSQGATVQYGQSGQVQTGSHGQSGQVQPPHTQAGSVASGQIDQTSPLSGLDTSAVQQTAQQHTSASAGGQLVNQSSQRPSMEDSQLSLKNVYSAVGELDQGIQKIQLSAIDETLHFHIQTVALAAQQRSFLEAHGVSVDEHLAAALHKDTGKPASSGAVAQQKHPETTKGTVKSK